MEKIIKQLEHTIEYFKDAKTDFQKGRVFEAEKILKALLRTEVVKNGVTVCENHNYVQKDPYWKSCHHCGMIAPLVH